MRNQVRVTTEARGRQVKRLFALSALIAAVALAGCVPIKEPAPVGPPNKIVLGDSEAALVGDALPDAENDAVGGTTACDTARNLPPVAAKVLLHVAGHSWGQYDAATWQACTLRIVDHYLAQGKQVFVATAPTPLAIYCGDPSMLAVVGIAFSGDPDYELRQRIEDANAWKMDVLPSLRPQVRIVDWRGFEHQGWPDCAHFTEHGVQQAVAATQAAGF